MSPAAPRLASITLGALAGIVAAGASLFLRPAPRSAWAVAPLSGRLVDEAAGPIDLLAFHYVPEAEPLAGPVYRALLPSLDPSTRLLALVPPPRAGLDPAARLRQFLGRLPGGAALLARTRIAVASGPISTWSKDRALVAAGEPITLFAPAGPAGAGERWLADWRAPADLARAFPGELRAALLPLDFDAGDLAIAGGRVLADANLLAKNAGRGLDSPARLAAALEEMLGMKAVVLGTRPGDVPRHHLSMYLAPLGDDQILVGDPRLARPLVGDRFRPGEVDPDTGRPLVADFSPESLARHDRAAADLAAAGFRVVRIPAVPFGDKTWFAYTNGLYETRAGRRVAWVPVFGLPALDQAALAVYAGLGWEVHPVPSRTAFPYHGTVGCLASVLARGAR